MERFALGTAASPADVMSCFIYIKAFARRKGTHFFFFFQVEQIVRSCVCTHIHMYTYPFVNPALPRFPPATGFPRQRRQPWVSGTSRGLRRIFSYSFFFFILIPFPELHVHCLSSTACRWHPVHVPLVPRSVHPPSPSSPLETEQSRYFFSPGKCVVGCSLYSLAGQ